MSRASTFFPQISTSSCAHAKKCSFAQIKAFICGEICIQSRNKNTIILHSRRKRVQKLQFLYGRSPNGFSHYQYFDLFRFFGVDLGGVVHTTFSCWTFLSRNSRKGFVHSKERYKSKAGFTCYKSKTRGSTRKCCLEKSLEISFPTHFFP